MQLPWRDLSRLISRATCGPHMMFCARAYAHRRSPMWRGIAAVLDWVMREPGHSARCHGEETGWGVTDPLAEWRRRGW
jgi:hypothetical protein